MTKNTQYLIAFGCLLLALVMGVLGIIWNGLLWPFQMIAAGWLGFGAGCLPGASRRVEPWLVAAYGAVASILYGFLLNLWFWPWAAGAQSQLSFDPSASVMTNLHHWLLFNAATSLGYDLPRAVVVSVLLALTARPSAGCSISTRMPTSSPRRCSAASPARRWPKRRRPSTPSTST